MTKLLLEADLDQLYVSVFRGWQQLERRLRSGLEPIDMDMANPSLVAAAFEGRDDADSALENLMSRIPDDHPNLRLHVSAARAVLALLAGELKPGREYLERTVHLPCTVISAESLAESRSSVIAALSDLRCAPALNNLPIESNLPVALKAAIATTETVMETLQRELHLETSRLRYTVSQVKSSGYWKSWVSGNVSDGLSIRFNTSPRRPYFVGDALSLALHEIAGHALQVMQRRALIVGGELAEAYGITGIFGPEQFLFEGLAQTMPDSLVSLGMLTLQPELRLARYYEQLRVFAYHNAHCMLLRGESQDRATAYVLDHLPAERQEVVLQELRDRTTDPFLCAYLFVYGPSDSVFSTKIAGSTRQEVANELYSWYTVPSTPNNFQGVAPARLHSERSQ